jgi:hypothetical protein
MNDHLRNSIVWNFSNSANCRSYRSQSINHWRCFAGLLQETQALTRYSSSPPHIGHFAGNFFGHLLQIEAANKAEVDIAFGAAHVAADDGFGANPHRNHTHVGIGPQPSGDITRKPNIFLVLWNY